VSATNLFGPGTDPGGTPPILPGPSGLNPPGAAAPPPAPGGAPGQDDPMRKILEALIKSQAATQRPQLAPTGVQAQPAQRVRELPPMFGITAGIQAIVAHEHQKKLAAATSDWNDLTTSIQKYIGQDGKVDPSAYQDPAVMQILGDPKKLKLMAKSLNQDWLNPEKTTVYGEALKRSLAQNQQKQQAASGLKQMMSHLIKKSQQPQLSPDQQQGMMKEVMSKAPIAIPQPMQSKEQESLLAELLKEGDADERAQLKEDYDEYKADRKESYDTWKTQTTQAHQESMERLRELSAEQRESSREATTLKALGIRLNDDDKRRLTITPAQMNTEVNGTLTSMRQQLTQATGQLKALATQAQTSKKWYNVWQGSVGDQQMKDAQSQVDNLKASVDYIEKNRADIISGKAQLDEVIDQAQSIASGTPPGFK
jgi:hypothetical protein